MTLLPLAISTGWAAGINAYAVVLLLGLLGRLGVGETPEVLQRTDVLLVAAALTLLDVVADKIPYVDSAWDVVHTAIRPSIAAVLGALLAGDATTVEQALAVTGTSLTALLSHLSKASLRLAINTSPEPASNVAVSVVEDVSLAGVVVLALDHPWLAAGVALALLALVMTLVLLLLTRVRRGWRRWRERRGPPFRWAG